MYKQYEDEPRRIEDADNATITFTIALHGPHAWEMVLEDSRRYHSISHGWATDDPQAWEDAIAPMLRQFFGSVNPATCSANSDALRPVRQSHALTWSAPALK